MLDLVHSRVARHPVELGAVEVPKTEDGKLDVTKIADPADFGDWDEQGCKG